MGVAAPPSGDGVRGIVHPLGEGHKAIGDIQLGPSPACLAHLQRRPTAVLTPRAIAYLTPGIGVASPIAGALTQGGVGPSVAQIHGACSCLMGVRRIGQLAICPAVGIERLGVEIIWLSKQPADTRQEHTEVDVARMAIGRAASVDISRGVGPPPQDLQSPSNVKEISSGQYFHYSVHQYHYLDLFT